MGVHDEMQASAYREVVMLLGTKASLRPGLDLERATDLLLLYAGTDLYHFLVEGRGWSHDQLVEWTVVTLQTQLFDVAVAPPRGRKGPPATATESMTS